MASGLLVVVPWMQGRPLLGQKGTGTLQIAAAIVAQDLTIHPVPKTKFLVIPDSLNGPTREVVTSFEGSVEIDLPPGRYWVTSPKPLLLEGRSFSWDVSVEIVAGRLSILELSNDNAIAEGKQRAEPAAAAEVVPAAPPLSKPDDAPTVPIPEEEPGAEPGGVSTTMRGASRQVTIPAGLDIYGELAEQVTSKKKETQAGDLVRARIWRDVEVDGETVIRAGAPMVVRVASVRGARIAGRKGKLELEAVSVEAVDGREILLDGGYDRSGKGKVGLSVTLFALVAWPLIFLKGKQAVLESGTVFSAQTQADATCTLAPRSAAPMKILLDAGARLEAEVLYDEIDSEGKNPRIPLRLRVCGDAVASEVLVERVNGKPIDAAVPLELGSSTFGEECSNIAASVNVKELGKHFRRGINTFQIRSGSLTTEVVLDVEL